MGFTRRYDSYPSTSEITQIEGVVIVDQPPPTGAAGLSTGVVACVGEFADMTYASSVNESGEVSEDIRPVEILSGLDLQQKMGDFDGTLGDFGAANGNGWMAVQHQFSRLVCVPVNLTSSKAVRVVRDLPLCQTGTNTAPVGGVIPAASVPAGYEFEDDSGNKLKLAQAVNFSSDQAFEVGLTGSWSSGSLDPAHTFEIVGGSYTASDIPVGSILVSGAIGDIGSLNAGTYRVIGVTDGTGYLTVEKMDGSSFATVTAANQPWRLHVSQTADSTVQAANSSEAAGCSVRVRALAAIAGDEILSPVINPTSPSASAGWPDGLYGLKALTSAGAIVYTAAVQAANAGNDDDLTAKYVSAIDALLADSNPAAEVNIVFSARACADIALKLKEHCIAVSKVGGGRMAVVSPGVNSTTLSVAVGSSGTGTATQFGVGQQRDERVIYSWPSVKQFVAAAENVSYARAVGLPTTTGILDVQADAWLAAVMSNLPPENNPGQAAAPVPQVLQGVLGYSSGIAAPTMADYIQLKSSGVCGIRIDRTSGPVFQSGITSSLVAGRKNIARRRMADFIQDSLSSIYQNYTKLPLTSALKATIISETNGFLDGLKSPNNPAAQRIVDYSVDGASGNTPALEAQGIFAVIVKVRTLASADFIVLSSEIGENVVITQQAA